MPVTYSLIRDGNVIHTRLVECVTDEEILGYYRRPELQEHAGVWREIVDGRPITDMVVTPEGQKRLAEFVSKYVERMRGGRVAMVAGSDLTYGMFRMWEMQRADLGYAVRVFFSFAEALAWVTSSTGAAAGYDG